MILLSRRFADGEGVSEYAKSIAEHVSEGGGQAGVFSFEDGSSYTMSEEVELKRVSMPFDGNNIYNWAMMFNNEMKGAIKDLGWAGEADVIHANDWSTVPAGVTLSRDMEVPLAVTIHSTENERGFEGEHGQMISELEWKGGYEAEKVLATNSGTRDSLLFDLDVPEEKLEVVDPYSEGWEDRILDIYREMQRLEVVKA